LLVAGASLGLPHLDHLRGIGEPVESPLPTLPFQDVRDDDDNEGDDESLFGALRYNADPDPTGQQAFIPENTPLDRFDSDLLSDFSDPEIDIDWREPN
jgi:hypothetical protein